MDRWIPQTSLRDLALVVFRRKWSVLAVFIVTILSALVYLFLIKDDLYELEAKVLVKIGREQAPPTTLVGERPIVMGYRHHDVNSEVDILKSTDLLAKVVDELHLDVPSPPEPPPPGIFQRIKYETRRVSRWFKDGLNELLIRVGMRERLSDRELAILGLQKRLRVEPVRDSNVLAIYLLVPIRQGSQIILNKLLDYYLDFRRTVYQDPTAVGFFTKQSDEERAKLNKAEENLQAFETQWQIQDLPQQIDVLINEINLARMKLTEAEISYKEAASKVDRLNQPGTNADSDYGLAGAFEERTFPENLLQQLTQLRLARIEMLLREPETGERVKNNQQQSDLVMGVMQSTLRSILAEKKAIYEDRLKVVEGLEKRLNELHSRRTHWNDLKREIKTLEDAFLLYERKLQESRANLALEEQKASNIVVLQHASDPLIASGLRKQTFLLIAMAMAFFAAIGWAAIAEFFDHRVYSAEHLTAHLSAPVLAVVPRDRRVRLGRHKHA